MRTFYVWSIKVTLPDERVVEASDITAAPVAISEGGLKEYVVRLIAAKQRCDTSNVAAFTYTEIPAIAAPDGA